MRKLFRGMKITLVSLAARDEAPPLIIAQERGRGGEVKHSPARTKQIIRITA